MLKNSLIGFKTELKLFDKILKQNKLPHAILLSGKESIGKRLFARELAIEILTNKLHTSTTISTPLNIEQIQSQIRQGTYPDLYLISEEEGKSAISIEQIRSLITALSLKSYYPLGSVVIIDNAHNMTHSAGNSLLKTLEEPEQDKYFILLSDQAHLIPETIRSRTQFFSCSQRTNLELREILAALSDEPNLTFSPKLLDSLEGSLAAFKLTKEIDPTSLLAKNSDNLKKKINQTTSEIVDLNKRIEKIISLSDSLKRKSQVIQFLRSSDKDTELLKLKINLLIKNIREILVSRSTTHDLEYWSELIPEFSKKLSEIQIRHLDPEIQLSAIL